MGHNKRIAASGTRNGPGIRAVNGPFTATSPVKKHGERRRRSRPPRDSERAATCCIPAAEWPLRSLFTTATAEDGLRAADPLNSCAFASRLQPTARAMTPTLLLQLHNVRMRH